MARPRPDQRKASILDAVVDVIIDVGFTQMTVADVAARAGVSTALVHYHFSSKTDLIVEALRVASILDQQLRDSIAGGPGTALDRLDGVLCGSMPERATDGSWLLWIETWGETRRTPAIRDVMAELTAHEHAVIRTLIDEGVANGEFVCPDAGAGGGAPRGVARRVGDRAHVVPPRTTVELVPRPDAWRDPQQPRPPRRPPHHLNHLPATRRCSRGRVAR